MNIDVLDHGFVRVVDTMGDDAAIVQAARVSYGEGTKEISNDRGLIRYLMRQWHSTPFEMCEIKLHVKLPIFVARQWIRHRTANVNEMSARYSVLKSEFYIPDADQLKMQSQTNKQGRDEVLDRKLALEMQETILANSLADYSLYEALMNEGEGLARELARMVLPANIYTEWYWKTDLHNLFHFLRLRSDPHAQWEIRQYADAISEFVKTWCPHAWEAFVDYRLEAQTFSKQEISTLRRIMNQGVGGIDDHMREIGMSRREITEFLEKIGQD